MLFWIPFSIWLIGFVLTMAVFLLLDDDKMTFAEAMGRFGLIVIWPLTLIGVIVHRRMKKAL